MVAMKQLHITVDDVDSVIYDVMSDIMQNRILIDSCETQWGLELVLDLDRS